MVAPDQRARWPLVLALLWVTALGVLAASAGYWPCPAGASPVGGACLLSWCGHGARSSLAFAAAVISISVPVGTALGLGSGSGGRVTSFLLTRAVELTGAWPSLILLALVTSLAPRHGTLATVLALGTVRAVHLGRLLQSETLRFSSMGFVLGARALGATRRHLVLHHLWPQVRGLVLAHTALTAAWSVGLETGLGLVGLGPEPKPLSWGTLLGRAPELGRAAAVCTALALAITTWAFYLLAEWMDEASGPKVGPITRATALAFRSEATYSDTCSQ